MSKPKQCRPGPGWRQCKCPAVWEHASGVVAHVGGMAKLVDDRWIFGQAWPESRELDRFIRVSGGNRRRGVLAWALSKVKDVGEWLDRHKLREAFFLVRGAKKHVREGGNIVEWKG